MDRRVMGVVAHGGLLYVQSAHDLRLPNRGEMLGGVPVARGVWAFPASRETMVRDLYLDLFGEWPEDLDPGPGRFQSVLLHLDRLPGVKGWQGLWLRSRCLAVRPSRDAAVELGPDVHLAAGRFAPTGGSKKHPGLAPEPGTVLDLGRLHESFLVRAQEQFKDAVVFEAALPVGRWQAELDDARRWVAYLEDQLGARRD